MLTTFGAGTERLARSGRDERAWGTQTGRGSRGIGTEPRPAGDGPREDGGPPGQRSSVPPLASR
ncbi:hypothetical protein C4B68_09625 [Streptomyces dengpaensis]|uniref:Uncharacterized protein n=1 Tax=Streptomyces dengpaensis TaxID=2049881 RepID=A0ABN5HZI4_9ACTN|nr:hypothetical protein C4B68_09625 [Streptomyces dengpaensis]PIB12237.1 hypothetical protein B1C81_03560 [Streptomyces sp. HG99]